MTPSVAHRVVRVRHAGRHADHLPDPPVSAGSTSRQRGHRHHRSRDICPPPPALPGRPRGWLATVPGFPDRLRENPPRQDFFEHAEYLAVRVHLPVPWQDILDVTYYSGWRKNEILFATWAEVDVAGGIIRLSPARSKTRVGRILPISPPVAAALARRQARRDPNSPLVFHRDGMPIRCWRTAWRRACRAAGVPTRFLHDCRRTAARNLVRAGVPERVAMLLTGHKSRVIFDRYNIVNEQELHAAGDQLARYLERQARAPRAHQDEGPWPVIAAPGVISKRWSLRRSNGSTGSTIGASAYRSATCRRLSVNSSTIRQRYYQTQEAPVMVAGVKFPTSAVTTADETH